MKMRQILVLAASALVYAETSIDSETLIDAEAMVDSASIDQKTAKKDVVWRHIHDDK